MRDIYQLMKTQLSFQYKAKYLLGLVVVLTLLCLISSLSQVNVLSMSEKRFHYSEKTYAEQGISLEQALKEDLTVKKVGNSEEINNPLKYDYLYYLSAQNALAPFNAPNQVFTSMALLFLPICFGVYAAFVGISDTKFKTVKMHLLISMYRPYFLGKIGSLFVITIFSVIWMAILSVVVQFIVNFLFHIEVEASVSFLHLLPVQLLYEIMIVFAVGLLTFLLTVLLKSHVFSILILMIYMLLVPNLGGLDLKNIMLVSATKIFNTSASSLEMIEGSHINLAISYFFMVLFLIIFTGFVYLLGKKRDFPKAINFKINDL